MAPQTRAYLLALASFAVGVLSLNACAAPPVPSQTPLDTPRTAAEASSRHAAPEPPDPGPALRSELIPIDADDPTWGSPNAPVTLVAFLDFECRFCKRAQPTLWALGEHYGPERLRIVFKHNPLPFHSRAMPAALVAQAVFELGGPRAFFSYASLLYEHQETLAQQDQGAWARQLGLDPGDVARLAQGEAIARKVARDKALAERVGARGTPNFRINGVQVSGAQPAAKFREVMDAELEATRTLVARGIPVGSLYATRVVANHRKPEPRAKKAPPPPDLKTYKVLVGKSPVRGPKDAPVTIVAFLDFECRFCKRVQKTLDDLFERYPNQLRLVFKHNALEFHPRAMPAAMLAIEAQKQKGNAGFWAAAELLWQSSPDLADSNLIEIGTALKLRKNSVHRAITKLTHEKLVEADRELAGDLRARGTPHFFINGRRLSGAQPIENFSKLIDEQLAKANALMESGIPRSGVYAAIMKDAIPAPLMIRLSPTPKDAPFRGPKNAPIVIHVFADFECPFCRKAQPTMKTLLEEFPKQVRIVYRHLPLPFHKRARPAAAAALEAMAQKGNAGFWEMHDLLYGVPGEELTRKKLIELASRMKLDVQRFAAALDDGRHAATIQRDADIAKKEGITGTPGFVINGHFVSGAQPIGAFRRMVERARRDLRAGKRRR